MIAQVPAMWSYLAWALVLAACAALSFLFSGMETGIYVMNKIRLDLRAESGSPAARLLRRMLRRPDNLLAILLIGGNAANYLAVFAVSAMFLLAGYGDRAEWYTMAVATPLLFVFCESVPKNIFQRLAEKLMYRLAWLMGVWNVIFNASGLAPLVRGYSWLLGRLAGRERRKFSPLGHESLASVMAESSASGVLTHFQSIMADRIIHISRVRMRDAMIPMARVLTAPLDVTRERLIALTRDHNYSRLPLLDRAGAVAGIVNVFTVLIAEDGRSPAQTMRPPLLIAADAAVTDALVQMQQTHTPMAIVRDTFGHHVGIVTMKDLVEEIVGELEAW